ncbi:hypothetical protein QBC45DRAFT_426524 [Copromyces sp. CBS 386.78]|nr:hypothetical protein QBC45DRAFT_426524 [Copromyces sp. CBS 386.78]
MYGVDHLSMFLFQCLTLPALMLSCPCNCVPSSYAVSSRALSNSPCTLKTQQVQLAPGCPVVHQVPNHPGYNGPSYPEFPPRRYKQQQQQRGFRKMVVVTRDKIRRSCSNIQSQTR